MEQTNYFQKLYFHKLGTPQSQDILVFENQSEPEWGFSGYVTEDGEYLIITVSKGTDPRYAVYYINLRSAEWNVKKLLGDFDAEYSFMGNEGERFWFKTNLNAPRGRVIEVHLSNSARDQWREIIPEMTDTLENARILNRQILGSYLKDAHSDIRIFDLNGSFIRDLELPGTGTAGGFSGKQIDEETFYHFTSYTSPVIIYRLDLNTGKSTIVWKPKLLFDPNQFETRQVFFVSKDGTRVPMFISHRKGLALDENNKTYLYGYGGFNISMTPAFSVAMLVWMEMGGVFALANLRGGGEYGEDWHRAGTVHHKQNVFDDFIAAAEWLISNKYTKPSLLAIGGGSNGGLLVTAAMIQRPDLVWSSHAFSWSHGHASFP